VSEPRWRFGLVCHGSSLTLRVSSRPSLTLRVCHRFLLPLRFRWRVGLVSAGIILAVSDVTDGGFEAGLVIDESIAAALRPPLLANLHTSALGLQLLQPSRAPRFQLHSHGLRWSVGRNHHVHMIRPTVHRMKFPATKMAVLGDRPLYHLPLFGIQNAAIFTHSCFRLELSSRIGKLPTAMVLDPAAFISR
jgi:hypothetical protein